MQTALARITTFKQLKHGESLSTEGVYLLKEGRIKIHQTPAEGDAITLEVLEPGEIFGAVTRENNETTAETLTETATIGVVAVKDFPILSETKTAFSDAVYAALVPDNMAAARGGSTNYWAFRYYKAQMWRRC